VLAADYQRLEFLRVLRSHELEPITDPGGLIAPPLLPSAPAADVDAEGAAAAPPAEGGGDVAEEGSGQENGGTAEAAGD
jgi:rod shape-determining protein MreC